MVRPLRPSQTPSARNDSELLTLSKEAADGDLTAIGSLLKLVAPAMIRSAHQLLGAGHADLDDVVQRSLICLVQALPSFRQECSVVHFACRIVVRTAVAYRRRALARAKVHDESVDVDTLPLYSEASDGIEAARRRELVRSLVRTLPEEQAEALALKVVLGFSLEEVADATQVPINTVKSRMRLAKAALKRRIEANPHLLEALGLER